MTRHVATKWILGIVIYFVILTAILSGANTFKDEYNLEDSDYTSSSGGGALGYSTGNCASPRVVVDPSDGDELFIFSNEVRCSRFAYYLNETECEYLEGCSWVNASEGWWFFPDSPAVCEGNLNTTYYDPNDETTIVCNWENHDEDSCTYSGCSWYNNTGDAFDVSDTHTSYNKGFFKVAEVIGDVVTLRVQFATDNSSVNALLTFFLIWIPLAILLLSGYIMIR